MFNTAIFLQKVIPLLISSLLGQLLSTFELLWKITNNSTYYQRLPSFEWVLNSIVLWADPISVRPVIRANQSTRGFEPLNFKNQDLPLLFSGFICLYSSLLASLPVCPSELVCTQVRILYWNYILKIKSDLYLFNIYF